MYYPCFHKHPHLLCKDCNVTHVNQADWQRGCNVQVLLPAGMHYPAVTGSVSNNGIKVYHAYTEIYIYLCVILFISILIFRWLYA